MFDKLRDRIAANREARRGRRRDVPAPDPDSPIDPSRPPAPGPRPGLLERLLMYAIFAWIKGVLNHLFAPTPGTSKGILVPEEFYKSLLAWATSSAFVYTATTILTIVLSWFTANISVFIPNPLIAALVIPLVGLPLDLLRRFNTGHVSENLPAGSIVPAGGALSPPPTGMVAADFAPAATPTARVAPLPPKLFDPPPSA